MPLQVVPIASLSDERLAAYRQLNDPARRRRVEGEQGIFAVEGRLAVEALLDSAYPVVSVLLEDTRVPVMSELLAGESAPVYVVGRQLMADTVGFDLHRGVVAIGRRLPEPAPLAAVGASSVLLVLEGVNDHENLGALFRNARALGAGAVLMDPTTADPLYRRSIRVSLGHVLRVPFARLDPWPAGLSDLRVAGYTVVALTPDRRAAPIDEPSTWPREWRRCAVRADRSHTTRGGGLGPVALLVGAEGGGLTAGARAVADVELRIPMVAGVDSLNVATAAAIALHRLAPSPPA